MRCVLFHSYIKRSYRIYGINQPIFFRAASLALGQSHDCQSTSEVILMDVGKSHFKIGLQDNMPHSSDRLTTLDCMCHTYIQLHLHPHPSLSLSLGLVSIVFSTMKNLFSIIQGHYVWSYFQHKAVPLFLPPFRWILPQVKAQLVDAQRCVAKAF